MEGARGRRSDSGGERGKAAVYAAKGPCPCARGATVRTKGDRRTRARSTPSDEGHGRSRERAAGCQCRAAALMRPGATEVPRSLGASRSFADSPWGTPSQELSANSSHSPRVVTSRVCTRPEIRLPPIGWTDEVACPVSGECHIPPRKGRPTRAMSQRRCIPEHAGLEIMHG